MKSKISLLYFFLYLFVYTSSSSASNHPNQPLFLKCISKKFPNSNNTSQVIYTSTSTSYLSVLDFTAQNPRFTTPQTPKPIVIITPLEESHIKAAIFCSKKHDIQIRIRSGGHDLEGLSYVSQVPFVIIDMINFQSVQVNAEEATAWVGSAATLGEIHYHVAQKSKNLAFPTGTCPTVCAGGHISGGGIGMLIRKYGISADNVVDARLIDVHGRVLDRKSMGEGLFWAIRGGGGASFGVILALKLKLVYVPDKVTVFTVFRTPEQNALNLVYSWQSIASQIDRNLSWRVFIRSTIDSTNGEKTIQTAFTGLYLGGIDTLFPLMQKGFPELGLVENDLREMSWIETVPYFYTGTVNDLLNRTYLYKFDMKIKADFVKKAIPEKGFEGVWNLIDEEDVGVPLIVLTALGGRMSQIPPTEIPFPHRSGNLYLMEYQTVWMGGDANTTARHVDWTRRVHKYLTPYVSKSPREAYLNYRDLDLGVNNVVGKTSFAKAKVWGEAYFLGNFKRLAYVKTLVDPSDFFSMFWDSAEGSADSPEVSAVFWEVSKVIPSASRIERMSAD